MHTTYPLDRAAYMVSASRSDHGGTFNPRTGKRATLTDGYMVGGVDTTTGETFIPHTDDYTPQTREMLAGLIARAEHYGSQDVYVGAWEFTHPDGRTGTVWEISQNVRWVSERLAVDLGAHRSQVSIWDVAHAREIMCPREPYTRP